MIATISGPADANRLRFARNERGEVVGTTSPPFTDFAPCFGGLTEKSGPAFSR